MAIKREAQGRVIVGEVTPGNDYKGLAGQRNLYIQLTADGATEESIDALNYLMDYAVYNNSTGKPIMPPDVNVWISNNGKTSAVEADDLSLEDGVYTICGIKCTNGTWDFSDAGQSGGGSGGGGGGLPEVTDADDGKVLTVIDGAWAAGSGGGGGAIIVSLVEGDIPGSERMDKTAGEILDALPNSYLRFTIEIEPGETDTQYVYIQMKNYIVSSGNVEGLPEGYNFDIDMGGGSTKTYNAHTLSDYPVEVK